MAFLRKKNAICRATLVQSFAQADKNKAIASFA
jgi:hypothetical protein